MSHRMQVRWLLVSWLIGAGSGSVFGWHLSHSALPTFMFMMCGMIAGTFANLIGAMCIDAFRRDQKGRVARRNLSR